VSFTFADSAADVRFDPALDHMNFRDLVPGTRFATLAPECRDPVEVWDEHGGQVMQRYFAVEQSELRTLRPVTPAMLTLNERVIRQDCLCYLMERLPYP
jgi:hypothetical protein